MAGTALLGIHPYGSKFRKIETPKQQPKSWWKVRVVAQRLRFHIQLTD